MEKLQCRENLAIPQPAGQSLTPIECIGAGANGFVLKVSDESSNYSALKIVPVIVKTNEENAGGIMRENRFYQYLTNTKRIPNLARAIAWWSINNVEKSVYSKWHKALRKRLKIEALDYPSQVVNYTPGEFKLTVHFVQMEYYTSGNLNRWLECNSDKCKETYRLRIKLFCDILSAVDFLHERDLMHRDICPNNIFLAENYQGLHAILGDFDSIVSCGKKALWPLTKMRESCTSVLGTDPYAAPEIDGGDYDKQCDLFSLGVVALNLFFNILDYNGLRQVIYKISEKNVFPTCTIADKSTSWLDIVKAQLSRSPQRRLSSGDLLKLLDTQKTLYLLQNGRNAFIKFKDFRFNSVSWHRWLNRSTWSTQSDWVKCPPMPEPERQNFSVAAWAGKMYVIGGYEVDKDKTTNVVQQYDTQTGWHDWPSMLEQREDCGSAVLRGRLFAVGGKGEKKRLRSVEECDLETGRWANVAPMTVARWCTGVAALDNLLFAVGGWDGNSRLNLAEWYDLRSGRWTRAAPMHMPRNYLGCAALGERLYVAGGCSDCEKWTASVEWFDSWAGKWTRVRDMGAPRWNFALVALNGQLLAAGGMTNEGKELNTVELYDEKRDLWSTLDVRLPGSGKCAGSVLKE